MTRRRSIWSGISTALSSTNPSRAVTGTSGRVLTTVATAETIKYASNAFLVTKPSPAVNARQRDVVIERLRRRLGTLEGRRVAVLGLAFKAGTEDLRDAPSLDILSALEREGAIVSAHDPVVAGDRLPGVRVIADAYDAADEADAVVLVKDWADYLALDLQVLRVRMRGNVLVDGRNLLDPQMVERAGLRYEGIGRTNVMDRRESELLWRRDERATLGAIRASQRGAESS
jgi:UDPglucose 6-dehydrogenase